MPRFAALAFVLAGACSGERNALGLGPAHAAYLEARDVKPEVREVTLRRFYDAFLEALRTKDPKKALRFYRPNVEPEAQNAIRMGLEFVKIMDSVSGELLEVRDLDGRALLKTRESASYRFRDKPTSDRRDRTYLLTRVGKDWYIDPPDFGAARKAP